MEVPERCAFSVAVSTFAAIIEEGIVSLQRQGLVPPRLDDYRLCHLTGGALGLEFDLHVASGVVQHVVVPLADNRPQMAKSAIAVCARLVRLFEELDDLLVLRAGVDAEVRSQMCELNCEGIKGWIVDVSLTPIDLTRQKYTKPVLVKMWVEMCDMLRPVLDEWDVQYVAEAAFEMRAFRECQKERLRVREAARSIEAVGFIDPLLLSALDGFPQPHEELLRSLVQDGVDEFIRSDRIDRDSVSMIWSGGIVRGVTKLADHVELLTYGVALRGTEIDETSVGRPISDFSDLPALRGLNIISVSNISSERATVQLDTIPIPFAANGKLLKG